VQPAVKHVSGGALFCPLAGYTLRVYVGILWIPACAGMTKWSDLPWSVVGLRPYFIWSQHQPTNAENYVAGYTQWRL